MDELQAKRARLEKKDFQPGDEVWFRFGGKQQTAKIVEVNGNSVELDFKDDYNENLAACTSTELEELTELINACTTAGKVSK